MAQRSRALVVLASSLEGQGLISASIQQLPDICNASSKEFLRPCLPSVGTAHTRHTGKHIGKTIVHKDN